MLKFGSALSAILFALASSAQTPPIPNGGFESWEGSGSSIEPEFFNSNKTGSSLAAVGPQTCFQETSSPHSGTYCVRMQSKYYFLAVVNGSMTSGVVNAPSSDKAEGYIGTQNYSNSSDIRRISFNGRPDSIVGYYKYTSGGTSAGIPEQGKVRAILHVGNYYDPETPVSGNHPDSSMNKIADALFLTPITDVTTWTRFSVPFVYADGRTPEYIMINTTSSANQMTTVPGSGGTGSQLWLDDMAVIYNPSSVTEQSSLAGNVKVFCYNQVLNIDFLKRNNETSVLTIYDITGKTVLVREIENNRMNSLSMKEYKDGIYLYQLSNKGDRTSGKFIVK